MELTAKNARVRAFDCPRNGDWYWNRYSHRIERADTDLQEKFLILELGVELEPERQEH